MRSYEAAQALESRTLLAGNVVAAVQNGNLTLTGDGADNSVELAIVNGDLVVRGLEGTTINGGANAFTAVDNATTLTGNLTANLGGGNDALRITGALTISGQTRITDVLGATQVGVTDATLTGAVSIGTGNADDEISIAGAALGSSLTINANGGDNFISVFDTAVEGAVTISAVGPTSKIEKLIDRIESKLGHGPLGRLRARIHERILARHGGEGPFGGLHDHASHAAPPVDRGHNQIVIEDSELGSLRLHTGGGNDNVVLQDAMIEGTVDANTGAGNDFVMVDGTTVEDAVRLLFGRGNDSLVAEGENTFDDDVFADGGPGNRDAEQFSDETDVAGELTLIRFELDSVPEETIESRGTETLEAASELREVLNGLEEGNGTPDPDPGDDPPALTLGDLDDVNDESTMSGDTLVTTLEEFAIEGQTEPGATVKVTAGTNGAIDLGTTTADSNGNFSLDVDLSEGATTIRVTSTTEGGSTTRDFKLHRAVGTVVRFTSSEGTFDVELFDEDAPNTVDNFLSYLTDYTNSFIHRAGTGSGGVPSVVQGGGFVLDGTTIEPIDTDAPIANEFNAARSNLAGTLSTALVGSDINSATSQWFFNMQDNAFLDTAKHTVFGRIIGNGLEVLEAIQDLPTHDVADSIVHGVDPTDALTNIPLDGYDDFSQALPGTVSIAANNVNVTGTGTNFLSTLEPGEKIQIDGVTRVVLEVTSDTAMTLTSAPTAAVTNGTVFVNPVPAADELVLFSSITVLLPAP